MFLSQLITRRKTEALIETLAQEIATACRQIVRRLVEDQCVGMSVNELRGYVRARAAGAVRCRTMQRVQGVTGLPAEAVQAVVRNAVERVVHAVVRDLVGLELTDAAVSVARRAA